MKTFMANPDKVERKWFVVDVAGKNLGRVSSEIAKILRGKNKCVSTVLLRSAQKSFGLLRTNAFDLLAS